MTDETTIPEPTADDLATVFGAGVVPSASANERIADIAQWLHALRIARDAAKQSYQKAEAEYAEQEAKLFDALEDAGLSSVRLPEIGLFSLNDLAWPQITDPEKALAWAEANHPEFVTLNHQRLQTPIREAIKEGREQEFADNGIGFTTSRKIRFTAAR